MNVHITVRRPKYESWTYIGQTLLERNKSSVQRIILHTNADNVRNIPSQGKQSYTVLLHLLNDIFRLTNMWPHSVDRLAAPVLRIK